jgi:hypothetical protein
MILLSPAPLKYEFYQYFYEAVYNKAPTNTKPKVKNYIDLWRSNKTRPLDDEYKMHQAWMKLILPLYFYSSPKKNAQNVISQIKASSLNWSSSKESSYSFYTQSEAINKKVIKFSQRKHIDLLFGEKDLFYSSKNISLYRKVFKHIRIQSFKNSGHIPWLEQNKIAFIKRIKQRLKRP